MDKFKTISENRIITSEIVEKKSKFIGQLTHVRTAGEAAAFLDSVRKKHHDARHNCSAYIIAGEGTAPDNEHSSDDGEPSGTAGKPILTVLKGEGLKNAVLVVTRYFGGILLGPGGLSRAYSDAAKEVVTNASDSIVTMGEFIRVSLKFDYANEGAVRRILDNFGVFPKDTDYADKVGFGVYVPLEIREALKKEVVERLSGAADIEEGDISLLPVK